MPAPAPAVAYLLLLLLRKACGTDSTLPSMWNADTLTHSTTETLWDRSTALCGDRGCKKI
jgi:hypothetical protein